MYNFFFSPRQTEGPTGPLIASSNPEYLSANDGKILDVTQLIKSIIKRLLSNFIDKCVLIYYVYILYTCILLNKNNTFYKTSMNKISLNKILEIKSGIFIQLSKK